MRADPDQSQRSGIHGKTYWLGWGLSGLVIALFLMDAAMKLLALPVVLQASGEIGFHGEALARELGVILLLCTLLYAAPPTAFLGAILLTGYLGGAVASHLRVGDPLLTHVLSGVYAGLFVWGGLYLRDARLRALFPLH
jgi:DoxX-like family